MKTQEKKDTKIIRIPYIEKDAAPLEDAAIILRRGGTVAFPTETVYGLGACALDEKAVEKIFKAKGRPADNPLIVHICDKKDVTELAKEVTPLAEKLMNAFWPGPLTLIFKRQSIVPNLVTAGLDTVAVRLPDHPVARKLICKSGVPVAAPSANLSGRPSPTCPEHVVDDLMGRVDAIVFGGPTQVGLESTVVDVTGQIPFILRPGAITKEDIEKIVGEESKKRFFEKTQIFTEEQTPKAPGMKYTHYAPKAFLYLFHGKWEVVGKAIQEKQFFFENQGISVGILTCDEHREFYNGKCVKSLGPEGNKKKMAKALFATLRDFDKEGAEVILSESFPEEEMGEALMNRLSKAAGPRIIWV